MDRIHAKQRKDAKQRSSVIAERYPYGELERFRIHLRRGKGLRLIATAEDPAALGTALIAIYQDGEIGEGDRVGILEAHRGPSQPGRWIVSPFTP
jgi:hypothetical protein